MEPGRLCPSQEQNSADGNCPTSMRERFVLLDGATATNLYEYGLPSISPSKERGICVEEWILAHPDAIRELQKQFIEAGSDIIYAPTFGANRVRLAEFGLESQTREYNLRLAALARESAERFSPAGKRVLVAGDLSPTGLLLEPAGEATFTELVEIYEEQAAALNEAGVDLFVVETMLSLPEARAAVLACRKYGKSVYVTMALNEHGELFSGGSFAGALVALQELGIAAFGLNCSQGPQELDEIVREAARFAKIPLIVKPSAGNPNPILPGRYELSPTALCGIMEPALDAGATIIGGCCGSTPAHIAELRTLLDNYAPKPAKESHDEVHDIHLATEQDLFLLDNDRIDFTEPVLPELDMADALLAAEEDSADVIRVIVDSPEEAELFAQNAHLARLPVCIRSDSEEALERALFLYYGRCMADRESAIPQDVLQSIAARYGALVY